MTTGNTSKSILEVSSNGGSSEQQAASCKVYCRAESVIPPTVALYFKRPVCGDADDDWLVSPGCLYDQGSRKCVVESTTKALPMVTRRCCGKGCLVLEVKT